MKASEQTIQQIRRFLNKVAQKFPANDETDIMTDIHIRASQDNGDLMAFDDNDNEVTRCVVEQWINYTGEDFYPSVTSLLRNEITTLKASLETLGIMKPYSFVLENDDKEGVAELYLVDDDTIIIGDELMKDLDTDLDSFLNNLMKEDA